VEYIVKHRGKVGAKSYFVKWKGYPDSDNSWVAEGDIFDESIIKEYEDKLAGKSKSKKPSTPKTPRSRRSSAGASSESSTGKRRSSSRLKELSQKQAEEDEESSKSEEEQSASEETPATPKKERGKRKSKKIKSSKKDNKEEEEESVPEESSSKAKKTVKTPKRKTVKPKKRHAPVIRSPISSPSIKSSSSDEESIEKIKVRCLVDGKKIKEQNLDLSRIQEMTIINHKHIMDTFLVKLKDDTGKLYVAEKDVREVLGDKIYEYFIHKMIKAVYSTSGLVDKYKEQIIVLSSRDSKIQLKQALEKSNDLIRMSDTCESRLLRATVLYKLNSHTDVIHDIKLCSDSEISNLSLSMSIDFIPMAYIKLGMTQEAQQFSSKHSAELRDSRGINNSIRKIESLRDKISNTTTSTDLYKLYEKLDALTPYDSSNIILLASESFFNNNSSILDSLSSRCFPLQSPHTFGFGYGFRGLTYFLEGDIFEANDAFTEAKKANPPDSLNKLILKPSKIAKQLIKAQKQLDSNNLNKLAKTIKTIKNTASSMSESDGHKMHIHPFINGVFNYYKCKQDIGTSTRPTSQQVSQCKKVVTFLDDAEAKTKREAGSQSGELYLTIYADSLLTIAEVYFELGDLNNAKSYFNAAKGESKVDRERLQTLARELQPSPPPQQPADCTDKDYYALLEIDKSATTKEIKNAFRKKMRTCHLNGNVSDLSDEEMKANEDMAIELNEANSILGDEEMRGKYDRGELSCKNQQAGFPGGGFQFNGFPGGAMFFNGGFPGGGFPEDVSDRDKAIELIGSLSPLLSTSIVILFTKKILSNPHTTILKALMWSAGFMIFYFISYTISFACYFKLMKLPFPATWDVSISLKQVVLSILTGMAEEFGYRCILHHIYRRSRTFWTSVFMVGFWWTIIKLPSLLFWVGWLDGLFIVAVFESFLFFSSSSVFFGVLFEHTGKWVTSISHSLMILDGIIFLNNVEFPTLVHRMIFSFVKTAIHWIFALCLGLFHSADERRENRVLRSQEVVKLKTGVFASRKIICPINEVFVAKNIRFNAHIRSYYVGYPYFSIIVHDPILRKLHFLSLQESDPSNLNIFITVHAPIPYPTQPIVVGNTIWMIPSRMSNKHSSAEVWKVRLGDLLKGISPKPTSIVCPHLIDSRFYSIGNCQDGITAFFSSNKGYVVSFNFSTCLFSRICTSIASCWTYPLRPAIRVKRTPQTPISSPLVSNPKALSHSGDCMSYSAQSLAATLSTFSPKSSHSRVTPLSSPIGNPNMPGVSSESSPSYGGYSSASRSSTSFGGSGSDYPTMDLIPVCVNQTDLPIFELCPDTFKSHRTRCTGECGALLYLPSQKMARAALVKQAEIVAARKKKLMETNKRTAKSSPRMGVSSPRSHRMSTSAAESTSTIAKTTSPRPIPSSFQHKMTRKELESPSHAKNSSEKLDGESMKYHPASPMYQASQKDIEAGMLPSSYLSSVTHPLSPLHPLSPCSPSAFDVSCSPLAVKVAEDPSVPIRSPRLSQTQESPSHAKNSSEKLDGESMKYHPASPMYQASQKDIEAGMLPSSYLSSVTHPLSPLHPLSPCSPSAFDVSCSPLAVKVAEDPSVPIRSPRLSQTQGQQHSSPRQLQHGVHGVDQSHLIGSSSERRRSSSLSSSDVGHFPFAPSSCSSSSSSTSTSGRAVTHVVPGDCVIIGFSESDCVKHLTTKRSTTEKERIKKRKEHLALQQRSSSSSSASSSSASSRDVGKSSILGSSASGRVLIEGASTPSVIPRSSHLSQVEDGSVNGLHNDACGEHDEEEEEHHPQAPSPMVLEPEESDHSSSTAPNLTSSLVSGKVHECISSDEWKIVGNNIHYTGYSHLYLFLDQPTMMWAIARIVVL
ncbi:hypothetical protein ADUPG1_013729, partial [Aduncisulcus paluster]